MTFLTNARAERKHYPRPSLHLSEPDYRTLLLRRIMRSCRLTASHAGVVAELAFRQGEAA